ncbi:MAG: hypothetical protein JST54_23180 [Deltaproteobacteria bacterium]|nr:hypothetical protein [Deltaproteobacteria bacterium]
MAKKKGVSAVKELLAASRKSGVPTSHAADDGAGSLPTTHDVSFLEKTALPAPISDRVFHTVPGAFTPRVTKVLRKEDAKAFFGSRLKPEKIVDDVTLATNAESVAARMTHGASIAQQIAAPAELRLVEQLQLIVDNAADFLAQFPQYQDDLEPALTWWTSTFPGGGPRQKPANGTTSPSTPSGTKPTVVPTPPPTGSTP